MKKTLRFLLVAVAAMWCCAASAKEPAHHDKGDDSRLWFPLGLSIIAPPVQLPSPSHSLFGAMVNLGYGQMTDVCLLDVGLINNVTSTMAGLEVGPVNIADLCYGAQVGAYARWFLAREHMRKGDKATAEKLYAEIRAKYPDAVTHKGQRFADFMPKPNAD